jgi:predicted ester cyclase
VNGKSISWDAIVIFRMKNGKMAEEWVSRDELGRLLSAGVLKAK